MVSAIAIWYIRAPYTVRQRLTPSAPAGQPHVNQGSQPVSEKTPEITQDAFREGTEAAADEVVEEDANGVVNELDEVVETAANEIVNELDEVVDELDEIVVVLVELLVVKVLVEESEEVIVELLVLIVLVVVGV
jgi:hypothetical protein